MIDWYVQISELAPESFKSDDFLSKVIDTATPCMDYFCRRLTETKDWKLEDASDIFSEIIDEMPILTSRVHNNEFVINYNRYVVIRLTETPTQIYRESKIKQLLS